MAELSLPVILQILQTAGILVGIFYYITVLNNQQKNQKHAEDTRKIQLLYEINEYTTSHRHLSWKEMMEMEWLDYDDFNQKYGPESNPDKYNDRVSIWRNMNLYGLLVEDGLIDISTYIRIIADQSPLFWNKFGKLIEEMRRVQDNPELYIGIEILARETDKYRVSKGLKPKGIT